MLKAIVWDFDGVIVDSEPLHYRAFLSVAQAFNITFTWEQYLEKYIGFDDRDAFRAILGNDIDNLAELCADKAAAFEQCVAAGVKAIPGSVELIRAAHGKLPMAICSGATLADINLMLKALDLGGYFDLIVSADDVARSKPHPAGYALAVERLGLAPQHCLAIEDTAAGIASARDAGLMTLALTTTAADVTVLHDASRVIDDLAGITLETLGNWYDD